jgi:hypothetical protein
MKKKPFGWTLKDMSTHPFRQPWESQYAIYQCFFVGKILQLAIQKKEGVKGTNFFTKNGDKLPHYEGKKSKSLFKKKKFQCDLKWVER